MSYAMGEVKSWLEHLGYFVPCRGVLVAGSGFGSWVAELDVLNIPRALFVEAQNSKIERMKKLYDLPQNWQVVQGVLWSEEAEVDFYQASNSALSGLVEPEAFTEIWPNATTLNVDSFQAITLKSVLEEYDVESSINWLVVDCFPAVKILQGALDKLDKYDVILARAVSEEEFIDSLGFQEKELNTFLKKQGFRQIVTFDDISPSVGLLLYTRDVNMALKKELETKTDELQFVQTEREEQRTELESELAEIKQRLTQTQQKLTQEKIQLAQEKDTQIELLKKELEATTDELDSELAEIKKEQIQTQERLSQEKNQVAREKDTQIEHLKKELGTKVEEQVHLVQELQLKIEELSKENQDKTRLIEAQYGRISILNSRLENMAEKKVAIKNDIENTLKKEIMNATQQLEAFLNIQSFLYHGEYIPGMHGWPISPDIGLYIIDLINNNDYDLIIEFGSGTSTVLIAKALSCVSHKRQNKPATRQMAFEHQEQYYKQTINYLKQNGLTEFVQVVLAPLQPYSSDNGDVYPYYKYKETLNKLTKQITLDNLKILVLVDGPPAATGKNARYPAIPIILEYFSKEKIDVVLDDYNRDEEKQIVEMWISDIKKQNKKINKMTRSFEKGIANIEIRQGGVGYNDI